MPNSLWWSSSFLQFGGMCHSLTSWAGLALRCLNAALLDQLGHQAGPAGLVAGAEACSVVAVKILIEQDQVLPERVVLKDFRRAVYGPAAVAAAQENPGQAVRKLPGHFPEIHAAPGASGAFHFESVAEVVVEFLQGLDEQEVYREPHRPAPVGVAA